MIESGAPLLEPPQTDRFEQTVTLAQSREEGNVAFGARVLNRLSSAEKLGKPFDAAALSASPSADAAVLAARRLIALGISAHGQATGKLTQVELVAAPHCGGAAKAALLALADELLNTADRPSVVSVRFRAPRG